MGPPLKKIYDSIEKRRVSNPSQWNLAARGDEG